MTPLKDICASKTKKTATAQSLYSDDRTEVLPLSSDADRCELSGVMWGTYQGDQNRTVS